eukprot:CAMPEP_0170469262 /NCGR_PEP_ID=MMETSP0123-20130129/12150_1 /TAXON_ID=182087 /ORGANISM="Favella ehrenbergii, Strain Fehren 1" /LENGTH=85 /DNA_ID=CAMNT_0010736071 /DNA_START=479 /DNA_END=736 /DNA_ORIENTATION=-
MYEPFSLSKLSKKGADLHELSVRRVSSIQRLSPRRDSGGSSPRSNSSVNRRSSSHFREIPQNTIAEELEATNEEQEDSDEESKDQ